MSWSVDTNSLLGLYYFCKKDSDIIEIVSSLSEVGTLKMLNFSSYSQIAIHLNLSVGRIDDLRKHNRENLFDFFPKFYEPNKNDYRGEYDIISDEIEKYNRIRFIVNENDTNSMLSVYYVMYEFYDGIKDKEISITKFDIHSADFLKDRLEYEKACTNERILSKEEIDNYKKTWEQELENNSEIRNIENKKIIDYSIDDISKKILEFMMKRKPDNTYLLIQELIKSNVLNIQRGLYIYNYIMEYMIKSEMIKTDKSGKLALNDQIRMEKIIY